MGRCDVRIAWKVIASILVWSGATFVPGGMLALPVVAQTLAQQDPADTDYPLGVADKVRIIVFDEPSLSGEFTVNANGALSLPLIGDVRAVGQTATEVAAVIRRHLMDGYVLQPRVSIDILTFRPFYILGEVNKPGEYPYSSGLTIDGAVATAQGYTYRADKRKVFIKHSGEAESAKARITPDLRVRPGDTIRVGERYL
ncbi:protein involved in polysaccharide export with SLBB domain [Sphingomonas sp. PvP056]|jgi:protein involved in polysaccharide export with SLBB domain